ncbi:hypothetical protein KKR91_00535 [Arthrobacter jiangjiafuii]|uniref:Uncharacterized protein n=1 Tax=Arthrobacter jiangjiafuii TaxID=2817475 RepID=A0A975M5F5_9MICC|nr:hypothetical protein [Arthrobacter jiangjiafuii]MBP3042027.1 hypothetical protein [Arthrobacter jiangjiafuii]QWC10185.1 hypothetical protein KKR91_00535 [Arthrobacter jiangjiafuii]
MVGNGSPKTPSGITSGRPSPAVYRRRRIVAGILALLVVIGLVVGIAAAVNALRGDSAAASETEATIPGPDSAAPGTEAGAADPAATPAPAASKPAAGEAPAEEPAPETPKLCPGGSVQVAATTDATSYPAGVSPMLTMTITNSGTEACDVNVGTSQMEFLVTSGSDRIFSSVDCMQASQDLIRTIEPNSVETAKFGWERLRSAPGCAQVPSNPNPGTYMFTARLGEISSEPVVFELE